MLKVECGSCKAPYQIDERRIPPTGLKMRCPKCGHSFLVTNPADPGPPRDAPPPFSAPPRAARADGAGPLPSIGASPAAGRSPKKTMVGLSPFVPESGGPFGSEALPSDDSQSAEGGPQGRPALPSDFPAALGFLDETDLPVVSQDLPAAKGTGPSKRSFGTTPGSPPPAPLRPFAFDDPELDLPAIVSDLPAHKAVGADAHATSPWVDDDLPQMAEVHLPVVAASLPVMAAILPSAARVAPTPTKGTPSSTGPRGFGEIDLPEVVDALPIVTHAGPRAQNSARARDVSHGAFGEIDLPRAEPPSVPPGGPSPADTEDGGGFGNLRLDGAPSPAIARSTSSLGGGGMAFGEVDFGAGGAGVSGQPAIGLDARSAPSPAAVQGDAAIGSPVATGGPIGTSAPRNAPSLSGARKFSLARAGGVFLAFALLIGGAALHVTPYGAFGYLYLYDVIHAGDYARTTSSAIREAQKTLGEDTYDAAKSAVEALFAAHLRKPRATALTAYAAMVDYGVTLRFGADASRASRARQLLAELPLEGNVRYRDMALAAQAAETGNIEGARKALDAAKNRLSSDPIQLDVARLKGDLALASLDGAEALSSFQRAAELSRDPRAHFGMARAYDLVGDASGAKKEIDATLAASPVHPGALTLRARRKTAAVDPSKALADVALVLDGPGRAKASPTELSEAYAARAWVHLDRGGAGEAREAFAQAVTLNPVNVGALNGEGRLLLQEGRFAEALARFDTALKVAPQSPETIANDAEAKIELERLADAKQQLVMARELFPKSLPILLVLGKAEQHLGNNEAAETYLRDAVAATRPLQVDAVLPYVALSELLAARGRLADAKAVLEDANKKLPPSSALERAFGQLCETQGDYDGAIAHYRTAVARSPKDLAAHFHLAVALRRVHRLDAASAEIDGVAAVDKNYPGLLLERGLLFEESGDVEKAIEQFKIALALAPEDPDLELRVGSAYVVIGRPDDALTMLHKVLTKRSTSAEAHHYIGRALLLKGPASEADALHYLHRAVELDPNRAEFHVYLAWAANDATPAQLELARDEIERALALDKLNPEAYWQRGVLERMEGAIDDAVKDERKALELRPSRYEAHATLAECEEDRNNMAGALTEWTRAIAGDGNGVGPSGQVLHPYWRYRYGKLLTEKGGKTAALVHLLPAAAAAEKMEVRPGWLVPLEFLLADALRAAGRKAEAIEHYRRYLDIAPVTSPDRVDARAAMQQLGAAP